MGCNGEFYVVDYWYIKVVELVYVEVKGDGYE